MTHKKKSKPRVNPKAPKPNEKKRKTEDKETPMQTEETPPATPIQPSSAVPVLNQPTPAVPVPEQPTPESPPKQRVAASQARGPQCYKCQRWGHLSYGCKDRTRCVKCSLEHRASECPKTPDQPCCCANCSGAHPSSYRGCPAAPKRRRRRRRTDQKGKKQIPGVENEPISKLVKVIAKLLTTKDFFTPLQKAFIEQELGEEMPAQMDATTQISAEEIRDKLATTIGTQTIELVTATTIGTQTIEPVAAISSDTQTVKPVSAAETQ